MTSPNSYTDTQRIAALKVASHCTAVFHGNVEKQVEALTEVAEALLPWINGDDERMSLRRESVVYVYELLMDASIPVVRRVERAAQLLEKMLAD